jgi:hypothetical protein
MLADYIRHSYKVTSELKSYTIFELVEVEGNNNLLTDLLRVEKFQGKSNAKGINDYLRLRTAPSWAKSKMITGLKITDKEGLYYGDWLEVNTNKEQKKTLLIFLFSEDRKTLFIDVYRGFYPNHYGILQSILKRY